MKSLLLLSLISLTSMAADINKGDVVRVGDVHCEATSLTGHTKFDYSEGDTVSIAITDGVYGRGIETHFTLPRFYVFSPTGDQELLKYGSSAVSFLVKTNGGLSRFNNYIFILKEQAGEGAKVYSATLMGTSVAGFPSVGKTIYTYIGKGSCEVKLNKKK